MPEISVHSAAIIKDWIQNQVRSAYLGSPARPKKEDLLSGDSHGVQVQSDSAANIINRQRIRDFFFSDLEYRDLTNLVRDLDFLMTDGNMACLPEDHKIHLEPYQAAIASSVVQYVQATNARDVFTQHALSPVQLLEQLGQAYTAQSNSRQEIRRQSFERDQRRWGSLRPSSYLVAENVSSGSRGLARDSNRDSEKKARTVEKTRWVNAAPIDIESLSVPAARAAMEAYYRLPLRDASFDVHVWNQKHGEVEKALTRQGVHIWVWGSEISSDQVLQEVHSDLTAFAYSDREIRANLVAMTFRALPVSSNSEDSTQRSNRSKARVTVAAFLDPTKSPSLQNSIDWELINRLNQLDLQLGLNANQKQLLREVPYLLETKQNLSSSHIRASIFVLEQALIGVQQGALSLQPKGENYLYYQINKLNLLLSQVPEAKIETHLVFGRLEKVPPPASTLKRGLEEAYVRFEALVREDPFRAAHDFAIYLVENAGSYPDYLNWATDVNAVLYYLNEDGEKVRDLARLVGEDSYFYERMDSLRRLGVFRDASAEFLTRRQLDAKSKKGRLLK